MNSAVPGLPHRPPFVFVGSVAAIAPGESAVCEKTFDPGDAMFLGHFPGNPIVPGVILTEALAQTAGIAAAEGEGSFFLLSAIRSMKFPSAARPGELIQLEARKTGGMGGLLQFEARASIDGRVVAEGQIILNSAVAPSRP